MADGSREPDAKSLRVWLGATHYRRWGDLCTFIADSYPGVFNPEWLFGGAKHGWALRFKKSKSFCTLIPERHRLVVVIVFGAQERAKAAEILGELSIPVRAAYHNATTYHDGKWLALVADRDGVLNDIRKLLAVKRKPTVRRPNAEQRHTGREAGEQERR
jgi:hypothetical protein